MEAEEPRPSFPASEMKGGPLLDYVNEEIGRCFSTWVLFNPKLLTMRAFEVKLRVPPSSEGRSTFESVELTVDGVDGARLDAASAEACLDDALRGMELTVDPARQSTTAYAVRHELDPIDVLTALQDAQSKPEVMQEIGFTADQFQIIIDAVRAEQERR